MVASVDLSRLDLWYRVDNENFRADMVYRAIAYLDYGESARGQLLFVTDDGVTYALPVDRTRCVAGHDKHSRGLRESENMAFFEPGEVVGWR